MRRRRRIPKPAQNHCRLCQRLFAYFQTTKRRMYCAPCVEIERKAANVFFNGKAREERIAARAIAQQIHEATEIAA